MSKVISLEDFKKEKKSKQKESHKVSESKYMQAFKKMTPSEIKMIDDLLEN